MLLAALLLALAPRSLLGETSARWRCEPGAVALGEPFELVLELEHPSGSAARALVPGALALGDSWVVLAEEPMRSSADGATTHTRLAWRVVSLEPGERTLSDELASFALSKEVAKIQVGEARVSVSAMLAKDEDAPRPLVEFPEDFTAGADAAVRSARWPWIAGASALALLIGGAALAFLRRRRRARPAPRATPIERLAEIEAQAAGAGHESCYALTRLLREATDRAREKDRAGLTDEEWLAELGAAPGVPPSALADLGLVFERAARVKYAGEAATPWALQETFARARVALQAVGAGGARE